ncbi:MAG: hypothetical protein HYX40_06040 [Sphingobacteriales bacterium]|nr:hypothetical protein [Sphingobacteriales bacterium]
MSTKSKLPPISQKLYGNLGQGHCKTKTKQELKEKTSAYRQELNDYNNSNETASCILLIEDIKYLIEYYSDPANLNGENPIDCFRLYFYRQDEGRPYPSTGQKILKVSNGKGQMSIMVVPANDLNALPPDQNGVVHFTSTDMFSSDDKCLMLTPGGESTGLCPTNCGKTQ